MTKYDDYKFSISIGDIVYQGTVTTNNGMMTVNSIYGGLTLHGTSIGRAKEALREIVNDVLKSKKIE